MSIEYLKRAAKTPETESATAQRIASEMLRDTSDEVARVSDLHALEHLEVHARP